MKKRGISLITLVLVFAILFTTPILVAAVATPPVPSLLAGGYGVSPDDGSSLARTWLFGAKSPTELGSGEVNSIALSGKQVIAGGYLIDKAKSVMLPCVWVDGTAVPLAAGDMGQVDRVCAMAGTWYASGNYNKDGIDIPCWWKKTARNDLKAPGSSSTWTVGIAVDAKGNVYVAGNYKAGANTVACVWKNGTLTSLSQSDQYFYARAIAIHEGKVVVVGAQKIGESSVACAWTDGKLAILNVPDLAPGQAAPASSAIAVLSDPSGLCVLVNFFAGDVPCGYFRNAAWTPVTFDLSPPVESGLKGRGFQASCIAVTGGIVYVGGNVVEIEMSGNQYVVGSAVWSQAGEIDLQLILSLNAIIPAKS